MPSCQTCGSHVSEKFARVCGARDDVVLACPTCANQTGLNRVNAQRNAQQ